MQKIIASPSPLRWRPMHKGSRRKVGTGTVIRVETAPGHLSIIELAEPVIEVAQEARRTRSNGAAIRYYVQPLDPEATTNLFIWTASGRLSYELVPAPSVQEMHFAIDQNPAPLSSVAIPEKPAEDPRAAQEAKLRLGDAVRQHTGASGRGTKNHARVEVILKDIYRKDDRIYVATQSKTTGGRHTCWHAGRVHAPSPRSSCSL